MVGAAGQLAAAGALRVLARHGCARHRRAVAALRAARGRARRHRGPPGVHRRARAGAVAPTGHRRAQALVLFGLSAQYLHPRAGRLACAGRHRLPLHGDLDGPQHRHLHPHGRRRRDLGRAGAVHRYPARVRQPGRRHLFPQRLAGDPPGGRGRRQHHLQDPLQRCGGDDRRPAGGRPAERADDQPPDGGRRHRENRGGDGRARQVSEHGRAGAGRAGAAPRRAGRGDARTARASRGVGADLRTDLRHREAPPPQARRLSDPRAPRRHQRARLRGLRRLLTAIALPVGGAPGHRIRAQARHRPVQLQQGLFVRERLLPELRHGGGRQAEEAAGPGAGRRHRRGRAAAGRARWTGPTACSSPASAAPAW